MSAKASGTDAGAGNGDAKHRAHHDGSSGRAFTVEQKTAVIRVRKCSTTAFYDILGLESVRTDCSEADIKKAYRKLSLLTHPDKNGYDGADEAFKMVSRAFQVLSDPEKKARFDKFGGDPDSRHSQAAASSPFSGFASQRARSNGSMFDEAEEISPEELFRQFFGGGMGGGFPGFGFDTGPQFVFNMGGPGIRVTQFGGQGPRRRPRPGEPAESQQSISSILTSLLPLILLFVLPLLSSLFSGSTPSGPSFRMDASRHPHIKKFVTPDHKVPYWVNPDEVKDLNKRQMRDLHHRVEVRLVTELSHKCQIEKQGQEDLMMEAQGWFFQDEEKMEKARRMELKACNKLRVIQHGR